MGDSGDTVDLCCCDRGSNVEGEVAVDDVAELREVVVVLVDRSRRTVGACSTSVYGLE